MEKVAISTSLLLTNNNENVMEFLRPRNNEYLASLYYFHCLKNMHRKNVIEILRSIRN